MLVLFQFPPLCPSGARVQHDARPSLPLTLKEGPVPACPAPHVTPPQPKNWSQTLSPQCLVHKELGKVSSSRGTQTFFGVKYFFMQTIKKEILELICPRAVILIICRARLVQREGSFVSQRQELSQSRERPGLMLTPDTQVVTSRPHSQGPPRFSHLMSGFARFARPSFCGIRLAKERPLTARQIPWPHLKSHAFRIVKVRVCACVERRIQAPSTVWTCWEQLPCRQLRSQRRDCEQSRGDACSSSPGA